MHLLHTGTALEELQLKDAAVLANVTTGAAYPRFKDQNAFRRDVMFAVLHDSPRHRDAALNAIAKVLQESKTEDTLLTVDDIPRLIEDVARGQQAAIRDDPALAVRLYALSRLALADVDRSSELRRELHQHDERIAKDWKNTVEVICGELGIEPAADTLKIEDFEIACSCLLLGLAIRQLTSDLPTDIYPRLVMALATGFFDTKPPEGTPPERRRTRDLKTWLTQKLTGTGRKKRPAKPLPDSQKQLGKVVAEWPRRPPLPEIDVSREAVLGTLASEPIRRALAGAAPAERVDTPDD